MQPCVFLCYANNMKEIVQEGNQVLRKMAENYPVAEIGSPKFNKIITDMNTALDSQEDGVAIAAPQIGESWRIFIVSGKVLPKRAGKDQANQVFVNPLIKKLSNHKITVEEGCLSVRWVYGKTRRADGALVEAYNEKGHKFARQGSGLIAQIFQHEIDHLNGVLFIDKASNLVEVKPEDIQHPHD